MLQKLKALLLFLIFYKNYYMNVNLGQYFLYIFNIFLIKKYLVSRN
uniref:Uncharacterized protein n=1 Tax=Myoviridae sp. ct6F13 TaxID=2827602 RepID=A0A8S5LJQ3_9CAUD|nr:MAG TPA: hypothetical protein [Myoviridae sp. ct6F13]